MPLVVPGIMTDGGDRAEEWRNKLVGKKLSEDKGNETVFCKRDLPQECRVIEKDQMVTKDFREDRLNVQLDGEGRVVHVHYG